MGEIDVSDLMVFVVDCVQLDGELGVVVVLYDVVIRVVVVGGDDVYGVYVWCS